MMAKRVSIRDDLYEYLVQRAEAHFRDPSNEVNAILLQLQREESDRIEVAGKVVKLEPVEETPRGPHNTISGYVGVYRYGKHWQARITRDGETARIGVFDDPEEAALAFDDAARASGHGSRLNFPTEEERRAFPQLGDEAPLPPELQRIKDETDQIIMRQPGTDMSVDSLPDALRRGLTAHGHAGSAVEDAYEEPELELADPDVDPDPAPTPA